MNCTRLTSLAFILTVSLTLACGHAIAQGEPAAKRVADLFVAPQGNDAWSGRLAEPNSSKTDGPLATIEHAQQLVRHLKGAAGRATPIIVAIRGGTYVLSKPIDFGPQDSGTEQVPIVYEAYGREQPILSGGVKLDGWQVAADGRWHKMLDEVKSREMVVCPTLRERSAAVPASVAQTRLLEDCPGTSAHREERAEVARSVWLLGR